MSYPQVGAFAWNPLCGQLSLHGDLLPLPVVEASILAMLAEHPEKPVSAARLLAIDSGGAIRDARRLWEAVESINDVLADRDDGRWFVVHHPSDGFSLVVSGAARSSREASNVLAPLVRVVGRNAAVTGLCEMLAVHRFVTVVGPGGLGKTTVARVVADSVLPAYSGGVFMVDLSRLSDSRQAPAAVAAAMGLALGNTAPLASLAAFVRQKRILLLLDSCEHVAEGAARVAEALLAEGKDVHVLATSREPLLAAGERLFRLEALATPAKGQQLGSAAALAYPAVELFLQRVAERDSGFEVQGGGIDLVVEICRRLDGLPLAIEIVAARAPKLGLVELCRQLDEHLLSVEKSTEQGPARHRTLAAMMDWTHEQLRPAEQLALRRLSVFRGRFTLDAAEAVVSGAGIDQEEASGAILDLVERSLLSLTAAGMFRLLDTTRAYASTKLASQEQEGVSRRHARFLLKLLQSAEADWQAMDIHRWHAKYGEWVDDILYALEACFGPTGEEQLGVELACASFELGRQMSLDGEFRQFMLRALGVLERRPIRNWVTEMTIHAHLGNMLHLRAPETDMPPSLEAMLQREKPHLPTRVQIVVMGAIMHASLMAADFARGAHWAEQALESVRVSGDIFALQIAQRMLAQTRHFMGRHGDAEQLALSVLGRPGKIPLAYIPSSVEPRVSMRLLLARLHWLQGKPQSAMRWCDECLHHAETDTAIARAQALALGAIPIALWNLEFDRAAALVGQLRDVAERHSLGYWLSWAERYEMVLELQQAGCEMQPDGRLLEAGPSQGNLRDHLCTFDPRLVGKDVPARVEAGMVAWCAPEVLRARAVGAMRQENPDLDFAMRMLSGAIALARSQGALAWELRASISLAQLLHKLERTDDACIQLANTVARFDPGAASADLLTARVLLAALSPP